MEGVAIRVKTQPDPLLVTVERALLCRVTTKRVLVCKYAVNRRINKFGTDRISILFRVGTFQLA